MREQLRGHHSLGKDASALARELNLELKLSYPQPTGTKVRGEEIPSKQIKSVLKQAQDNRFIREVEDQTWEGKLFASRTGRMMSWIRDVSTGCMLENCANTQNLRCARAIPTVVAYEVLPREEGQDA